MDIGNWPGDLKNDMPRTRRRMQVQALSIASASCLTEPRYYSIRRSRNAVAGRPTKTAQRRDKGAVAITIGGFDRAGCHQPDPPPPPPPPPEEPPPEEPPPLDPGALDADAMVCVSAPPRCCVKATGSLPH